MAVSVALTLLCWGTEGTKTAGGNSGLIIFAVGSLAICTCAAWLFQRQMSRRYQWRQLVEREQLSSLVENSSDLAATLTTDGHLLYMNFAGLALAGVRNVDLIKKLHLSDLLAAEQREMVRAQALAAALNEGAWRGELLLSHLVTGHSIEVACDLFRVSDPQTRKPVNLAMVMRDIREQKRVEQSLRESERRLRELADAMPQIVWAFKADGTLDYVNQRWFEMTGLDFESTARENWLAALYYEDAQERANHGGRRFGAARVMNANAGCGAGRPRAFTGIWFARCL